MQDAVCTERLIFFSGSVWHRNVLGRRKKIKCYSVSSYFVQKVRRAILLGKGYSFKTFAQLLGQPVAYLGCGFICLSYCRSDLCWGRNSKVLSPLQVRKLKLCGSCSFIQEVAYRRTDKCFLYLFPSPIPSSIRCPPFATYPVCFAARDSLPVAWC